MQSLFCFQIYAWPLLQTLLSEVLTKDEWLRAWDNIFSNHPSFLLFVVVAYVIVSRKVLLQCSRREDFEVRMIYTLIWLCTDKCRKRQRIFYKDQLAKSVGTAGKSALKLPHWPNWKEIRRKFNMLSESLATAMTTATITIKKGLLSNTKSSHTALFEPKVLTQLLKTQENWNNRNELVWKKGNAFFTALLLLFQVVSEASSATGAFACRYHLTSYVTISPQMESLLSG